ncbi:MAG: hypothetical protein AB7F64_09555 [Gammaproteobacteria bacterium]
MNNKEQLKLNYKQKLEKAITYLEYSYNKINKIKLPYITNDPEELEIWESFCARFSRVVDLFLTKYIRAAILLHDPGFEGTLRDFVNQAEKLNLLDNADQWMSLRELRNINAHEYTESDLSKFLERLYIETPFILTIKNKLK